MVMSSVTKAWALSSVGASSRPLELAIIYLLMLHLANNLLFCGKGDIFNTFCYN